MTAEGSASPDLLTTQDLLHAAKRVGATRSRLCSRGIARGWSGEPPEGFPTTRAPSSTPVISFRRHF